MGGCISHLVCRRKEDILAGCEDFAFCNVDREENPSGSYHGNMNILTYEPVKADYDEACEFLDAKADGKFYQDYAVRFYNTDKVKKSKKVENLEERVKTMWTKRREYEAAHSVTLHKSELIGCKKCNSKLAIKYLRTEKCPVCCSDLRADYILERLDKFGRDIKDLEKQIRTEKQKAKEKAPIEWCFRVSVHT